MSVLLGVLGMGRAQAAARMTEAVTIVGEPTFSTHATTLAVTQVDDGTHYTGTGRVKFLTTFPTDQESAGQLPATQRVEVHIPAESGADIVTGDLVTVTASTADSTLVGKKYRIAGLPDAGQVTARRFPVEAAS